MTTTETAKTPRDSQVEMTEMVLPQHTNALGTIFGGVVMSWVDIAAAICALRHARRQVVTASVDALDFVAPIKLGWVANLKASVNYVSHSSCEIGVKITSENPVTGEVFHTASAYVTMVALDSHGRPTSMPPIKPETPDELRRFKEGEERRRRRVENRKRQKSQTPVKG